MMSEILNAVWEMVRYLPMREVKQTNLDEEVHKLAYAALPDPSQKSLHSHYVQEATGLLGPILEKNDKTIVEYWSDFGDSNFLLGLVLNERD
ncbi:hypothetical protein AgCh_028293 [Apium graveolens]